MKHPYEEYENTPIWTFVNEAVQQLTVNRDIQLLTSEEHVIRYLCQQFSATRKAEELAPIN